MDEWPRLSGVVHEGFGFAVALVRRVDGGGAGDCHLAVTKMLTSQTLDV